MPSHSSGCKVLLLAVLTNSVSYWIAALTLMVNGPPECVPSLFTKLPYSLSSCCTHDKDIQGNSSTAKHSFCFTYSVKL